MKKFLALTLSLIMVLSVMSVSMISVNAETSKVSTSITVIGTNRGTLSTNGTDTFTVKGTAPNDTGVAIGFNQSEFEGKNITQITYTFTGSATFNQGANYWFMYDNTYAKTVSAIGASKFQNGKINADTLPSDAVIGAYWQTYNDGKTLVLKGEKLQKAIENKFSYLYIVHARNSGCVTGDLKVAVEIEYKTGAPTTDAVATQDGASIRLSNENGIRFYTTVDETKLAELVGENTYEIGTLIAPADALGEDGELTEADDCLDVKYQARDEYGNIDYFNPDNKEIVGSIVNIRETDNGDGDANGNIDREFAGRAYVKVGDTYYFSATTSIRSLAQVAYAYKNSESYIENEKVEQWAAEYVA